LPGFGEPRRREAACVAFGDLFSIKGRDRRQLVTAGSGLELLFPLWGRDTRVHADAVLGAGLSAWVCSVDTDFLPADRVGRRFDAAFVTGLPTRVDPYGGDDEFHTVVEWAPGWKRRVHIKPTRRIEAYNFAFAEMERRSRGADASPHDVFGRFARLDRVRRYVDGHLAEDVNSASAAKVAAMSPTGFSRYFREHVGTTFTSWLTQQRVEHACHLLRENNDVAVSRVAEAVGFHSERTFRGHFHEQMGLSPLGVREESAGGSQRSRIIEFAAAAGPLSAWSPAQRGVRRAADTPPTTRSHCLSGPRWGTVVDRHSPASNCVLCYFSAFRAGRSETETPADHDPGARGRGVHVARRSEPGRRAGCALCTTRRRRRLIG